MEVQRSAPPGGKTTSALRAFALLSVLVAASLPARAGKAHEHGVARADVGVEAGRVTLSLEVPLEDLVGFERVPRNDAERAAVAAALGKLQGGQVVRVDAAGGCGAAKVDLRAPVWGLGVPAPGAPASAASSPKGAGTAAAKGGAEHGDLQATFEFRCSNTDRATHLELGLFEAFARVRRIEVQAVTPKGQMKLVLRRPNTRVALVR